MGKRRIIVIVAAFVITQSLGAAFPPIATIHGNLLPFFAIWLPTPGIWVLSALGPFGDQYFSVVATAITINAIVWYVLARWLGSSSS